MQQYMTVYSYTYVFIPVVNNCFVFLRIFPKVKSRSAHMKSHIVKPV